MTGGTWKRRERQAARALGAERAPGSGSMGRSDLTRSDSTHERLFIETKTRKGHAARTLYEEVKVKAKQEGKVPVVALASNGKRGFLLCVHSDDLRAFVREVLGYEPDEGGER